MRARTAAVLAAAVVALVGCGGGGTKSSGAAAVAQPANAAQATRTVDIEANDDLKFVPANATVAKGATVAFKVTNVGKMDHEFEVGNRAFQDDHEKEMRGMPAGMDMPDEATGFDVKPGETKTIAFTFPAAGTLLYGCHEPGHYAAGMKGTIKVS